jgi:ABC-type uncharacterized transport system permease subunit
MTGEPNIYAKVVEVNKYLLMWKNRQKRGINMRIFLTVSFMIICTITHCFFTSYTIKKQRKDAIVSGIILTILGLGYSTIQTQYIIKKIGNKVKGGTSD